MTELPTNSDVLDSEEALKKRQKSYDQVRRLFDVSNDMQLKVTYPKSETMRPHESDRVINASFEAMEADTMVAFNRTDSVQNHLGTEETVNISMRLFPSGDFLSVSPNGISILLTGTSPDSIQYGGTLLPSGEVFINNSRADEGMKNTETREVNSVFALVEKLIQEGRLIPTIEHSK
jgi:hypothetical protein